MKSNSAGLGSSEGQEEGLKVQLMVEQVLSTHKVLGSIPSTQKGSGRDTNHALSLRKTM